jgi:ribosomal protein S18 acetylase RimI-like enzyme
VKDRTQAETVIRQAGVEDAALLARLCLDVHRIHAATRPDYFKPIDSIDVLVHDFRNRLVDSNHLIFIAEREEEAVGYLLAQLMRRPESVYTYAKEVLVVDQMSVLTEHRSKGFGDALMRHALDTARARGYKTILLNVWAFNERAIAFYERHGFTFRDHRMELHL